jgi:hypothetical protein
MHGKMPKDANFTKILVIKYKITDLKGLKHAF